MKMWKIYVILTSSTIILGLNLALVKYLVSFVGPVTMTTYRLLLAGITVFTILSVLKLIRWPTRHEWKFIISGALLNVVLHHYFLNIGLVQTTGTNAGLILGTGPVLTAISASLVLRNYPSKIQWLGFFLGLAGVSFVVLAGGGLGGLALGDGFVLISILAQVFSFLIIAQAAKTLDPRLMTAYMLIIGSISLFIIGLIQEPGEIAVFTEVPAIFWLVFATSGIVGTAVGHMLYNYSVGQVGPSKAAIFINLNTMFSLVGAALFLGEIITFNHLIGLFFIIAGVILGSGAAEDLWKNRKQTKKALKKF